MLGRTFICRERSCIEVRAISLMNDEEAREGVPCRIASPATMRSTCPNILVASDGFEVNEKVGKRQRQRRDGRR